MDDITLWPTYRQAAAIAKGELASRELLDAQLARIETANPALNAVVSVDAERARSAAGAADDAVARGESIGPLHGVPVTLKDAYEVAGWTSTGGSTQRSGHVPDRDAPAVAALREAGIVLLGRTNVPEWSGDVQTYNDVFGVTNNPWDTSRTPGGSSGGAGVAVATGMSSFELGTDIGGSVRIPAAFNGVCGHKPTLGRGLDGGLPRPRRRVADAPVGQRLRATGSQRRRPGDRPRRGGGPASAPHPGVAVGAAAGARHHGRRHPLRGLVRRAVVPDRPRGPSVCWRRPPTRWLPPARRLVADRPDLDWQRRRSPRWRR